MVPSYQRGLGGTETIMRGIGTTTLDAMLETFPDWRSFEKAVEVRTAAGPVAVSTAPVTVTIEGVIPKAEETPQEKPEIAGLKAPRSIPPDYGPAKRALAALAGLLVAAGIG